MGILDGLFGKSNRKMAEERQGLRDSYWRSMGTLETDVLANLVNPAFLGMPAWPDLRQAYKVVRTSESVLIGTDGLSDDFRGEKSGNGFGIELFVESRDETLRKMESSQLSSTWLFQLLFQAACNAAQSGAFYGAVEKYQYVSSELGNVDIGGNYKTESDGVGVLLGVERNRTPTFIEFRGRKILFISVTAILRDELDFVMENGKKGREELVAKLREKNLFNAIDSKRASAL